MALKRMETDGILGPLPMYSGRVFGVVLYIIPSLKHKEKTTHRIRHHTLSYETQGGPCSKPYVFRYRA